MIEITNKKLNLNASDHGLMIGAWVDLASPLICEILGSVGFDWVLIDAEHGPNSVPHVLSQLQAIAAYSTIPVVRLPNHDASLIKRYLDIGATNLLVPFVNCAEQATEIVRATRYPPHGIRGAGAGLARVSRWGTNANYLLKANQEITLLLQVETNVALNNVEEIASVEGVDGIFFGPADIAASVGKLGMAHDPVVQQMILDAINRLTALNKPSGVFSTNREFLEACSSAGGRLIGATSDVNLLVSGGKTLLASYKEK